MKCAALEEEEVLRYLNSSFNGIDPDKYDEIVEQYGNNSITKAKSSSAFLKFLLAFFNPFSSVLIALAIISFFTNVVFTNDKDPSSTIIIVVLVIISGFMHFFQDMRSDKAGEKLKNMVQTVISITRKGQGRFDVPLDELVVGDIVYLAAGDMIPADMRILKAKDLFVSQSSLTGESEPIEKFSERDTNTKSPLYCKNLVFLGTNIVSGSAIGIVVATGDSTFFGSIAKDLNKKKEKTNFEKGIWTVSKLLIKFMSVMVVIVFLLNGLIKHNWLNSLLFALSIAVGLTPEMLPMIVTTNLARGAVSMSKKKIIVKNLNSIQNFGAMDILCTDKTGTLTQDEIILEYYLDIEGNSNEDVLKYAFLNSYYQTGLKNMMDLAIIKHANDDKITNLLSDYKKIDEIPFDFSRRRMSVVVERKDGLQQLITKGAIEEMLKVCNFLEKNGKTFEISEKDKKEILKDVQDYNYKGLRVLGIAKKTINQKNMTIEENMTLTGYLAFLDPPKASAQKAIKTLYEHGVDVKVLTGDNMAVTKAVCKKVGILECEKILLGSEMEEMTDIELANKAEECSIFAKLTPVQKARIVSALRQNGHVIGFMGDGINDASAMKTADVGISVDTAVDIAKESANIILLEKDLNVLYDGVISGRKVYANIIKYIKMTISSNFGNMFSVLFASAFLPFIPMLPVQILLLNLISDISCLGMPWDNVDEEYLKNPKNWNTKSIGKFMVSFAIPSTLLDILTFLLLYFVFCPKIYGSYVSSNIAFIAFFQTGWFLESLWTQTIVMHMLRTEKLSFIKSNASINVYLCTICGAIAGTILPYMFFSNAIGFVAIKDYVYFLALLMTVILYIVLISFMKVFYIKKYKELL